MHAAFKFTLHGEINDIVALVSGQWCNEGMARVGGGAGHFFFISLLT